MVSLNVNGNSYQADVDPRTPLLWVLRDAIGLTGTKYGCGIAQCGACTVHLDGVATRSCSVPVSAVGAKKIATIEASPTTAPCTRYSRPGLITMYRNAGIARAG